MNTLLKIFSLILFPMLLRQPCLIAQTSTPNFLYILQNGEVYLVDETGADKKKLTSTAGKILTFTQFPDGKGIYYGTENGMDLDIFSFNSDYTGKPELITKLKSPKIQGTDFYDNLFPGDCFDTKLKLFVAKDKILALPCNCCGEFRFCSLYRIDVPKKYARYYEKIDKVEKEKTIPFRNSLNKKGEVLKSKIVKEGEYWELYIKEGKTKKKISDYDVLKVPMTDFNSSAFKVQSFDVSPNGSYIIYDVYISADSSFAGETVYYNIATGKSHIMTHGIMHRMTKFFDTATEDLYFEQTDRNLIKSVAKLTADGSKTAIIPNTDGIDYFELAINP